MDKNGKRGFIILLVFLAIIGVISLIGFGVFGIVKLTEKIKDGEEDIDVVKVELDESFPQPQTSDISNSVSGEKNIGGATSSSEINGSFEDVTLPEVAASVEQDEVELEDDKLQIVIMGDSIIDNFRDETGIAYLLAQSLDANVINLAIGGTCASISIDDDWTDEGWNATCGAGVAKAVCGLVNPDVFYDCTAKELIKSHMDDFKNTDIFIIEYGINDFMFGRQICDLENLYNPTTYEGGLRQMLKALTMTYPDAKIVMCQPSYVEFFRESGEYVGNSYVLNNGPGTEYDYGRKMGMLCLDYKAYFFSFEENGITMLNASETLLDGIHLNENGRRIYADNLSKFIQTNVIESLN